MTNTTTAKILSGKEVAAAIMEDNRKRTEMLTKAGRRPTLAVFRIGRRPDDVYYEQSIRRHCDQAGIDCRCTELAADADPAEFKELLGRAAADPGIQGIFFFSPLPKSFNEDALRQLIPAAKDVDCLSRAGAAAVFCGDGQGFAPCTPAAVMEMLRFYQIPLAGRRAVVLGRSLVVGKPLAMLLLAANATVTICHSRTEDLPAVCREADILLAAVGSPRLVRRDWLRPGQVIIDVGMNPDPENPGKMCGDVAYEEALEPAAAITPVPGGVGLVTTALLCRHVIEAAENLA